MKKTLDDYYEEEKAKDQKEGDGKELEGQLYSFLELVAPQGGRKRG